MLPREDPKRNLQKRDCGLPFLDCPIQDHSSKCTSPAKPYAPLSHKLSWFHLTCVPKLTKLTKYLSSSSPPTHIKSESRDRSNQTNTTYTNSVSKMLNLGTCAEPTTNLHQIRKPINGIDTSLVSTIPPKWCRGIDAVKLTLEIIGQCDLLTWCRHSDSRR